MLAAPLILGLDLTSDDIDWALAIVKNAEAIAIAQDPLGAQGACVETIETGAIIGGVCTAGMCSHTQSFLRKLEGGAYAAAFVNRGDRYDQESESFRPETMTLNISGLGGGAFSVRDVWEGEDLGVVEGEFVTPQAVQPHAVMLVKLTPV